MSPLDKKRRMMALATGSSVLVSPSSSLLNSHLSHFPIFFRKQQDKINSSIHKKIVACSCNPSKPMFENGFSRRDLVLFGISSTIVTVSSPFPGYGSEEEVKMVSVVDDINAYTYSYPLELPSKKYIFKWAESRKPERYSSAAPLSHYITGRYVALEDLHQADARQRIVTERVDLIDNLILSVSIGPPNSQFLKSMDKSTWNAKDVADSVLSDKSALRVTSSQRKAESSILDAHSSEVDGETYWYYEYLIRKSPTRSAEESNIFRHYVASTFERDGFLYSLNASTLSKQWNKMGPILEKSVSSFRRLPPTESYVPPFKDPWRFW